MPPYVPGSRPAQHVQVRSVDDEYLHGSCSSSTAALARRMRRQVHLSRLRLRYVSIYLRGCGAGVPQQLLHDPQVGPAVQQVRGEGVAERVGMHARRQPGPRRVPAHLLLDAPPAEAGVPNRFRNSAAPLPGCDRPGRTSLRYSAMASCAADPMSTARSLAPLPTTRSSLLCRFRSWTSRSCTSLTRSPAAYTSSSSARSRTPRSSLVSGDDTSVSASSWGQEAWQALVPLHYPAPGQWVLVDQLFGQQPA